MERLIDLMIEDQQYGMADSNSDSDCDTGDDFSLNGDILLEYRQGIQRR
jgi:hypothetical protein